MAGIWERSNLVEPQLRARFTMILAAQKPCKVGDAKPIGVLLDWEIRPLRGQFQPWWLEPFAPSSPSSPGTCNPLEGTGAGEQQSSPLGSL